MSPRTGKPINFRLNPELAARVEAAAKRDGVTLAEWWQRAALARLEVAVDALDLLREAQVAILAERAKR